MNKHSKFINSTQINHNKSNHFNMDVKTFDFNEQSVHFFLRSFCSVFLHSIYTLINARLFIIYSFMTMVAAATPLVMYLKNAWHPWTMANMDWPFPVGLAHKRLLHNCWALAITSFHAMTSMAVQIACSIKSSHGKALKSIWSMQAT